MEEVLSNQQARPGDATQLMHVIFSSDDEMMAFYLPLNRFQSADAVGTLMNCILNTTKNSWQFKKMDRNNDIHLQNVRYLLNRLDATESNEEKNCEEVAI